MCRIPSASQEFRGALRASPWVVACAFALEAATPRRRRAPAPRPPSRRESFAFPDLLKPKSKARAARATRTHYAWHDLLRLEAVARAVGRGRKRRWSLVPELPYGVRHAR